MKKFICSFLTISIVISGSIAFADGNIRMGNQVSATSASENPFYINGDSGIPSTDTITIEDIDTAIAKITNDSTLTEEEKQMTIDKLIFVFNATFGGVNLRDTVSRSGSIAVPVFTQENGHYCGPATVKQTLTYINGSADTQDNIAAAIKTTEAGSTLENMVNYVNVNKNGGSTYRIIKDPSKATIQSMVENDVRNGLPVMCRLKFSRGGSWQYTTAGHFMNANGYTNYGAEICVTDPNIKRVDSSASGAYWVTIQELYLATHNHFAQEMAY